MNYIKYLILLLVLTGISKLSAQMKDTKSILLSNYSFTTDNHIVGQIGLYPKETPIKKVKIKGKDASFFSLDEHYNLIVKKNDPRIFYQIQLKISDANNNKYIQDFTIVKDEFLKNKVVAHRGAWKNFNTSENSVASLKNAIKLGCQGSEFDVHLSSDSVAFLHHDADINGKVIEQTSSSELRNMKLSNGEYLPTLTNFLEEGINQNKTKLILEIKPTKLGSDRVKLVAQKIIDDVKNVKAQAWIEYISFDYEICKALLALDPFVKVAYLNGDKSPKELYDAKFYGLDYHYSVYKKNPSWIKESLDLGLTVNAWTVNDQENMKWLISENVDFITTNEPEILLEMVK